MADFGSNGLLMTMLVSTPCTVYSVISATAFSAFFSGVAASSPQPPRMLHMIANAISIAAITLFFLNIISSFHI